MEEETPFDFLSITLSWFHMMLFYYSLRLDIAVGVLRDSHRDQWPRYWFRNFTMDLECAGWLVSAYAGRQTVPPPVARGWVEMLNASSEADVAKFIQYSERLNRETLLTPFRTLLPFWRHNNAWPSFGMDNTWWLYPLREYSDYKSLHTTDKTFKRAFNYFNGTWPKHGSPLHEAYNRPYSMLMDGLHAELQSNLIKLRETEGEMREAWEEVQSLTEMSRSAP